jgi:hypothetical protein
LHFAFPTNLRTNQFVTYENDGSSAMFYMSSLLIQLPTILQMDFLSYFICLSLLLQLPTNYGLAHRDHLPCVYWTFYLLPDLFWSYHRVVFVLVLWDLKFPSSYYKDVQLSYVCSRDKKWFMTTSLHVICLPC